MNNNKWIIAAIALLLLAGCVENEEVWFLVDGNMPYSKPVESEYYTKLSETGEPLGYEKRDWSCVADSNTGLTWEVKSYNQYANNRYDYRYTWFTPDEVGDKQGVQCSDSEVQNNVCDTDTFVGEMNALSLCGYSDWRIPSVEELKTLIADKEYPKIRHLIGVTVEGGGTVNVNTAYFPTMKADDYWTSDTDTSDNTKAHAVSIKGKIRSSSKAIKNGVVIVRGSLVVHEPESD